MKLNKILTSFVFASLILMIGCKKDETNLQNNEAGFHARQKSSVALLPSFTESTIAVLAGTTITNDGPSYIKGDIAVSPGTAITGFQASPYNTISGPGTVTLGLGIVEGTIYAGGPVAAQAHNDAIIAYNYLSSQVPDTTYSGVTQLDGKTFTPGIYRFAPSANLQVNGNLYLDFQGNSDAQFIFQFGTTLVTMAGSNIIALNNNNLECNAANVFWTVGSSATLDGNTFIGNVIANTTITMASGVNVSGRIWAINGAVTMISDSVSICEGTNSNDHTPTAKCRDFVTGGGTIESQFANHTSKDKASFGVSGGIKNNKFWGQLSFNDHHGVKVKSTSITNYIIIDSLTRQIDGIARVNGNTTLNFTVIVKDNGEPGTSDYFSVTLSDGYTAYGTLTGGNIQLHYKCGASNSDDNESYDDENEKKGNKTN